MAFCLLIFTSVWIPPDKFWPAGFIAYSIPLVLLINLFLFLWRIKNLRFDSLFPLIVLIAGYGFIRDTISFNPDREEEKLKILTFNAKVFNLYNLKGRDTVSVGKMLDWIRLQDADVLCFQEFYNDPGSSHFNTIEKIRQIHNFEYFSSPIFISRSGGEFGPIIFSRYPIVNKGILEFDNESQNNVIFADLKIDEDTIRIYNMHLHSMHISEDKFINPDNLQEGIADLGSRLKNGFIQRAQQIRQLKEHLEHNRLPLLLCGDLNDIPYSYAYQQLDRHLKNGFTEAGNGFGFTYNGKFLYIRIDHQFYSDDFRIHTFKVNKELTYSDHFPVIATYSLNEQE